MTQVMRRRWGKAPARLVVDRRLYIWPLWDIWVITVWYFCDLLPVIDTWLWLWWCLLIQVFKYTYYIFCFYLTLFFFNILRYFVYWVALLDSLLIYCLEFILDWLHLYQYCAPCALFDQAIRMILDTHVTELLTVS